MPDVTKLLEQDHREVEDLFSEFEQTGDRSIALRICDELDVHTSLEEEIVYPALAREIDTGLAQEGRKEHGEAARIMRQIRGLSPDDGRLRTFVAQLKDSVMHHVEEEEEEVFPKMQDRLGDQLSVLGQKLTERKQELMGSDGIGNGNGPDATKEELYEQAREAGIEGRSKMSKEELARALQRQ